MIRGKMLRDALRRAVERRPMASDWRKATNGRVVRFVDWRVK